MFIADQVLHLAVIALAWLFYTSGQDAFWNLLHSVAHNTRFWLLLLSYILLTVPSLILIDKVTCGWNNELEGGPQVEGLKNAGKWIGIIERVLVFTFIIVGQLSAGGFLLAAKSVFRFGDLKDPRDQKKTEYIIVGTFISFGIAVLMGFAVRSISASMS